MKFKPGQPIFCIGMDEDYSEKLVVGGVYILRKYKNSRWIYVAESTNDYEEKYFIPAEITDLEKKIYGDTI